MPELIDSPYPNDPTEPIDGFYEDIASDSFTRTDEAGAVHTFDFVVSQFLGNYEDSVLGLTSGAGEIIYKVGADGNGIDKVINPTQIQFRVRNSSGLLDKMRGGNKRDFKLKIYEDGNIIFHGYLLLNTRKQQYYQTTPEVEMRAYDGLALLNNIPVSSSPLDYSSEQYITVKDFLTRLEARMGIQLGWLVHTNYNDPSRESHFPNGYEFKIGELIRGLDEDKRTWGNALELFARNHFGMQVYQWQGKWHMIGRAERATDPQAITTVDMDAGTVSTTDFTGPLLDQSNAIRFPDGEVIDGLAEVRGNVLLAHGFLQNEDVSFNSISEVPYWQTNDISAVQGATTFDQVLRFNTLGSSTVSQLSKTVMEAHLNPIPSYNTRFTVSVEVEILAKDQNSSGDVAVDVDLFKIFTVDPSGDLDDDSEFSRLITGGKPDDLNDTTYANDLTADDDTAYFTIRADQKRSGQAGKLKEAISITKSFDCVLKTHSGLDDIRRYLRVVFNPKAAANQNGGDASLLDKVNLVSMRISRADASNQKKFTSQQQPTSAPNFSQRTDRFTGKNQGESISLKSSLTNKGTYNGLFGLRASILGGPVPVTDLALNGIDFPYAATRARMAMQAVHLDRVKLRTRHPVGTSPLQALSFVIDASTTIRIIPIAWKRSLTSGFVSITAAEARYDTGNIDAEAIYGPVDSGGTNDNSFESGSSGGGGIAVGDGGGSGITDHGELDGREDDDHPQYFNQERGDGRYLNQAANFNDIPDSLLARTNLGLGEGDVPQLAQLLLGNAPATQQHAATKAYVDAAINNLDWQESVLSRQNVPPSSPAVGDRYLVDTSPTGSWVGHANQIAVWEGSVWSFIIVDEQTGVPVEDVGNLLLYVGGTFVPFGSAIMHSVLQGLDADDHLQYVHINKVRTILARHLFDMGFDIGDDARIASQVFSEGFAGEGIEIQRVNGQWRLVLDDLVVRNTAKFYELVVEQLRANATYIMNEGHRIDQVVQNDDLSEVVLSQSDIVLSNSEQRFIPNWDLIIPEDQLLQFQVDDLIKRQQFTGRSIGVTEATVLEVEFGSTTVTDNSIPRGATVKIEAGSDVPTAEMEFVRLGNLTDPSRQGGIIITSSTGGGPYRQSYDGVDSFEKFGDISTIRDRVGLLDGLDHPEFSELDGTQENLWGALFDNAFLRGSIVITGGQGIQNLDDAGLLAGLDNLDQVPDGDNFAKVSKLVITSEGFVQLSETVGNADDIAEGVANKFAAESGADVTSNNQAASFSGQGGLSLKDQADWLNDIIGAEKPAANADVTSANPQGQSWLTDSGQIVNENDSILRLVGRVLDNIGDGSTYSRVRTVSLMDGLIKLVEAVGSLDDIDEGTTFGKIKQTAISAGKILLQEAIGDLGDVADGGGFQKVSSLALTAQGFVQLSQAVGSAADIDETAARKWAAESGANITGNHEAASFTGQGALATKDNADYVTDLINKGSVVEQGDSLTRLTDLLLDNLSDGATYGRIRKAQLIDGMLQLSEAVGVLSDIPDGGGFAKILDTQLSAGKLLLRQALGTLDDVGTSALANQVLSNSNEVLSDSEAILFPVLRGVEYTQLEGGKIVVRSADGTVIIEDGRVVAADLAALQATIGNFKIDLDAIYSGTKTAEGYSPDGMTVHGQGSLHAKNFYVDRNGNIRSRKGDLIIDRLKVESGTQSVELTGSSNTNTFNAGDERLIEVIVDGSPRLIRSYAPDDITPPEQVTDASVTAGASGAASSRYIDWTDVSDAGSPQSGMDHYDIYRQVTHNGSVGNFQKIKTLAHQFDGYQHQYEDTDSYAGTFANDQNYTIRYKVVSVDGSGNSAGLDSDSDADGNVDSISLITGTGTQ